MVVFYEAGGWAITLYVLGAMRGFHFRIQWLPAPPQLVPLVRPPA